MLLDNAYIYAWLGLMVILIGIEAATVNLTTIWLAGGSLVAFILALFNLPLWLQITAFFVVSIVMIIFTRPIAVKYLKVGTQRTNVDALIGTTGLVTMDISEHKAGQVKVKGQIWTAVSESGESILADTEVDILAIEGVKLIVKASDKT
ncbi:MAG: NfeD family protein [Clostridiaceae bacterium]|jgi:membrane protein implicated in regulation of membrane protease activity|nr:NfeD family protein [Clostridiaceae bacterium]